MLKDIAHTYKKRFPNFSLPVHFTVKENLRTIIVVPCYKEPEILKTLESLAQCHSPKQETLILVLVNASETASEEIKRFNRTTYQDILDFIKKTACEKLQFEVFLDNEMPAKNAGVGYARKTLMDTALSIFAQQNKDGILVNTDADCLFSKNYLQSIENAFENSKLKLAVMHYEHRIEDEQNPSLVKAITEYELHLRYYKQALEYTGYPNVLETIGSCMVCLASTYALEGGMNKRKAAEDFYFINKLAKSHKANTITEACVKPSCRTSDRVPFGTGKAMNDYLTNDTQNLFSYDFRCFIALKDFLSQLHHIYENDYESLNREETEKAFFNKINLNENLKKIKMQSNHFENFKTRFFFWFDHLKALQFIHFYTEEKYPKLMIQKACQSFLKHLKQQNTFSSNYDMLVYFRNREKNNLK